MPTDPEFRTSKAVLSDGVKQRLAAGRSGDIPPWVVDQIIDYVLEDRAIIRDAIRDADRPGAITLKWKGYEIVGEKPDRVLLSLGALAEADPRGIRVVSGSTVCFADDDDARYKVVSWDAQARALLLEKQR